MSKIVVLGGANIDLIGKSKLPLVEYDSNPGTITLSYGGVGRNIAENLCLLDENVYFATVFGNDQFAQLLKKSCHDSGMDLSLCKTQEESSSIYLAVLDHDQDMKVAVSDMEILDYADIEMINNVLNCCNEDDVLVIDGNLSQSMIEYAVYKKPCVLAIDPISCAKAVKVKNVLHGIDIFKPNRYEAQLLSGIEIISDETAAEAVKWFLKQGVKEVFISLAQDGVVAGDAHEIVKVASTAVNPVNVTGGGDSFLAALIAFRALPLTERCKMATCMALSTIMSENTVNRSVDRNYLYKMRNEIKLEEKILCTFE